MANKWIDISYLLSPNFPSWPGDIKYSVHTSKANEYMLSSKICMSSHSGTHIDASSHYAGNTETINDIPIDKLFGKVKIIEVFDAIIDCKHIKNIKCKRVIFKTRKEEIFEFDEKYTFISPDAASLLVDKKICLVGIDTFSVENIKNNNFDTHKILLSAGIIIIECLNLCHVAAGNYNMIALPIKTDAEASLVRVLIKSVR